MKQCTITQLEIASPGGPPLEYSGHRLGSGTTQAGQASLTLPSSTPLKTSGQAGQAYK